MIRIDNEAWSDMVAHAKKTYPNECCGAMLGTIDSSDKDVKAAVPLVNAFAGEQGERAFGHAEPLAAIGPSAQAARLRAQPPKPI